MTYILYNFILINKNSTLCAISGGTEQDRTAVRGFADLCLTTRPRRHTRSIILPQASYSQLMIVIYYYIVLIKPYLDETPILSYNSSGKTYAGVAQLLE